MANEQQALAVPERKRLTELEAVIERGLGTFMEVGTALMEIREQRLYRETHGTFAAYCGERWSFSDRRARQLMVAAEIGTTVPVPSERHARALAPLIADRGLDAASEFMQGQPESVTAVELERAVKLELNPASVLRDSEEFRQLVRELDYEELAEHLLTLNPEEKYPKMVAAVMKLEESQREVARALVAAVQEMISESEEKSISLEEVVGELGEGHAWLSERGCALIDYAAMKAFAEGNGSNEIQRVEMLSWELADNDVTVEFQPRHFVRWCEGELEARAA